jgi:hypothetical protein
MEEHNKKLTEFLIGKINQEKQRIKTEELISDRVQIGVKISKKPLKDVQNPENDS